MISDSERRAVATRMREIMHQCPHGFLDNMITQSILDVMGEGVTIGETVADFIDRPTCFDTESQDSEVFTCSVCGFTDSRIFVNPFTLSLHYAKPNYHYCPSCGREIKG